MLLQHLKSTLAFFGFGIVSPAKDEVRKLVMEKSARVAGNKVERFTRGNISAQKGTFITKAAMEQELKRL